MRKERSLCEEDSWVYIVLHRLRRPGSENVGDDDVHQHQYNVRSVHTFETLYLRHHATERESIFSVRWSGHSDKHTFGCLFVFRHTEMQVK